MAKCYGKLCGMLDALQSPLLLLMRLYWGYQFFITGRGKLMHLERVTGYFADLNIPWPHANAILAGTTECVCGLLLLVGLASRLVSIPLMAVLAVAYATAHQKALLQIFSDPELFVKQEPFPFLVALLVILVFGPGKFSVDSLLKKKYCEGPL